MQQQLLFALSSNIQMKTEERSHTLHPFQETRIADRERLLFVYQLQLAGVGLLKPFISQPSTESSHANGIV